MYHTYWGLHESPFQCGANRRAFHRSPTHDEALARLHYLVDERRRIGLLLGESGSGKSLLLEVFAAEIRRKAGVAARLNLTGLDAAEFPWKLAAALAVYPEIATPMAFVWRAIGDRLGENRRQKLNTVLLFDDATGADEHVLDQIVRLSQHSPAADAQLTIVLAGCPEHLESLGTRLLTLAELRIDLQPWDPADTAEYITESLRRVGREAPAFDEAALARLHELAGGTPRRVNQLADLSLLAAAGEGRQLVDDGTVETVCEVLGVRALTAR